MNLAFMGDVGQEEDFEVGLIQLTTFRDCPVVLIPLPVPSLGC